MPIGVDHVFFKDQSCGLKEMFPAHPVDPFAKPLPLLAFLGVDLEDSPYDVIDFRPTGRIVGQILGDQAPHCRTGTGVGILPADPDADF